ncbi:MAG TPA: serine hydrolase domain-containing protein [Planctomycetota bacterium]
MRNTAWLLLAFAAGCAARPPRFDDQKLAAVDALMKEKTAQKKLAGAIILAMRDGRVEVERAYGSRDLEASKPMLFDTIFRIYSMSKAITTAAALTLVDEGKLKLDDPIGLHVPELKDLKVVEADVLRAPRRAPNVRDLMLHTAGFTYGGLSTAKRYAEKKPLEAANLDEFATRLADVHLAFDPGTDWHYGINTDVLGLVVQRVAKKPLGEVLRERIFAPLGMIDTAFWVPADKVERFAANYRREASGLKLIDAPGTSKYLKPPGLESGGGGLVGTAADYLRFLSMVESGGGKILKPDTARLMTSNQLPPEAFPIYFGKEKRHGVGFGLGFSVRTADTEWDPAGRTGEYGWGGAASTHYWVSPRDRLIVVTMEQTMPYNWDTEFGVKGLIYGALK